MSTSGGRTTLRDLLFGPLVAFGLGGIHVEVLGDVRFRVAPLTDRDADELLHEIRGLPLLAKEVPEIAELDLNPVIALAPGLGCRVVDARIKVTRVP